MAGEQKTGEPYLWLLTDEERAGRCGAAFQELIKRNGQIVVRDHSAPSVHLWLCLVGIKKRLSLKAFSFQQVGPCLESGVGERESVTHEKRIQAWFAVQTRVCSCRSTDFLRHVKLYRRG